MKDVESIVKGMSRQEKIALVSGSDAWHIAGIPSAGIKPSLVSDGPHGLRIQTEEVDNRSAIRSTCFPPACLMACSWDEETVEKTGRSLGQECVEENVAILLGPGANIKRSPLCGRNFEYYSEDPYLSGKLAAAMIRGIESTGTGACLKHYAGNSQERFRLSGNSVIDMRALREIYLKQFEIAVAEGRPASVMASYNRVNGVYSAENSWLINEVLRKEWGFDGIVMTDWGAMNDKVASLKAGVDLEMPGPARINAQKVSRALENGNLTMDELDECVTRIVSFLVRHEEAGRGKSGHKDSHEAAVQAAAGSFVLLENDGILPLKQGRSYALIGAMAEKIRYQGAGSSLVSPIALDDIRSAFSTLDYAPGYDADSGDTSADLIEEAVRCADAKDAALVVLGLPDSYEAEGFDRRRLDLPSGQIELVNALIERSIPVIVILLAGSPVLLPFRKRVNAMLMCYLGGEALGSALRLVLEGQVSPSGKLAETFPLSLEDTPCHDTFASDSLDVLYKESIFTGYRYYDRMRLPVAYEFGYGLSYTSFSYSDLKVTSDSVSFTLSNIGAVGGSEICQLYIGLPQSRIPRPVRELRGFRKVFLESGGKKTVTIPLSRDSFTYFDVRKDCFDVEEGDYEICIAASSRDIRLRRMLHVDGNREPFARFIIPFESLFSGTVPVIRKSGRTDVNTTLARALETEGGREVLSPYAKAVDESYAGDDEMSANMRQLNYELPIRGLWMSPVPLPDPDDAVRRINEINDRNKI